MAVSGSENKIQNGDGTAVLDVKGNENSVEKGSGDLTADVDGNGNNLKSGDGTAVLDVKGNENSVKKGNGDLTAVVDGNGNNLKSGDGNAVLDMKGNRNKVEKENGDLTADVDGNGNSLKSGDGNGLLSISGSKNSVEKGNGDITAAIEGNQNAVKSGDGKAVLEITGNTNSVEKGDGDVSAIVKGNSNAVKSGDGNSSLDIKGDSNKFDLGNGDLYAEMSGNSNTLNHGDGNRSVVFDGNKNKLNFGDGDSYVRFKGNSNDLKFGDGNNTVGFIGDKNKVEAGNGDNYIAIWGDSNSIKAGDGNNYVTSLDLAMNQGNFTELYNDWYATLPVNYWSDSHSYSHSYSYKEINPESYKSYVKTKGHWYEKKRTYQYTEYDYCDVNVKVKVNVTNRYKTTSVNGPTNTKIELGNGNNTVAVTGGASVKAGKATKIEKREKYGWTEFLGQDVKTSKSVSKSQVNHYQDRELLHKSSVGEVVGAWTGAIIGLPVVGSIEKAITGHDYTTRLVANTAGTIFGNNVAKDLKAGVKSIQEDKTFQKCMKYGSIAAAVVVAVVTAGTLAAPAAAAAAAIGAGATTAAVAGAVAAGAAAGAMSGAINAVGQAAAANQKMSLRSFAAATAGGAAGGAVGGLAAYGAGALVSGLSGASSAASSTAAASATTVAATESGTIAATTSAGTIATRAAQTVAATWTGTATSNLASQVVNLEDVSWSKARNAATDAVKDKNTYVMSAASAAVGSLFETVPTGKVDANGNQIMNFQVNRGVTFGDMAYAALDSFTFGASSTAINAYKQAINGGSSWYGATGKAALAVVDSATGIGTVYNNIFGGESVEEINKQIDYRNATVNKSKGDCYVDDNGLIHMSIVKEGHETYGTDWSGHYNQYRDQGNGRLTSFVKATFNGTMANGILQIPARVLDFTGDVAAAGAKYAAIGANEAIARTTGLRIYDGSNENGKWFNYEPNSLVGYTAKSAEYAWNGLSYAADKTWQGAKWLGDKVAQGASSAWNNLTSTTNSDGSRTWLGRRVDDVKSLFTSNNSKAEFTEKLNEAIDLSEAADSDFLGNKINTDEYNNRMNNYDELYNDAVSKLSESELETIEAAKYKYEHSKTPAELATNKEAYKKLLADAIDKKFSVQASNSEATSKSWFDRRVDDVKSVWNNLTSTTNSDGSRTWLGRRVDDVKSAYKWLTTDRNAIKNAEKNLETAKKGLQFAQDRKTDATQSSLYDIYNYDIMEGLQKTDAADVALAQAKVNLKNAQTEYKNVQNPANYSTWQKISNAFNNITGWAGEQLSSAWNWATTSTNADGATSKSWFGRRVDDVKSALNWTGKQLSTAWNWATTSTNADGTTSRSLFGKAVDIVSDLGDWAYGKVKAGYNTVKDGVKSLYKWAINDFSKEKQAANEELQKAQKQLESAQKAQKEGLDAINEYKEAKSKLATARQNLEKARVNGADRRELSTLQSEIRKAEAVLKTAGENRTAKILAYNGTDGTGTVTQAKTAVDAAQYELNRYSTWGQIKNAASDTWNNLKSAYNWTTNKLSSGWDWAKNQVKSAIDWYNTDFSEQKNSAEATRDELKSKLTNAKEHLSNLESRNPNQEDLSRKIRTVKQYTNSLEKQYNEAVYEANRYSTLGQIKNAFSDATTWAGNKLSSVWNNMTTSDIHSSGRSIFGRTVDLTKELGAWVGTNVNDAIGYTFGYKFGQNQPTRTLWGDIKNLFSSNKTVTPAVEPKELINEIKVSDTEKWILNDSRIPSSVVAFEDINTGKIKIVADFTQGINRNQVPTTVSGSVSISNSSANTNLNLNDLLVEPKISRIQTVDNFYTQLYNNARGISFKELVGSSTEAPSYPRKTLYISNPR